MCQAFPLREPSLRRLVDVDDVCVRVPRVGVELRVGAVLVDLARPILGEQAHDRGAAGAAVEPKDERVLGRIGPGLEEPEEV